METPVVSIQTPMSGLTVANWLQEWNGAATEKQLISLAAVVPLSEAWQNENGPSITGEFDFLARISNQDGLIRYRKVGPITVFNHPRGNFKSLYANANWNLGPPLPPVSATSQLRHGVAGVTLPYSTNVEYATNLVEASWIDYRFSAQAGAIGKVLEFSNLTQTVSWSPNNSAAAVLIRTNVQTVGERATANWRVFDPTTFDTSPGEQIEISFSPQGGAWEYHFPPSTPGYEYTGVVDLRGMISTTYSGWNELLGWNIILQNNGTVSASLSSHPVLGLDNEAIANDIESRFSFDPKTGDWVFDENGFELVGTFEVSSTEVTFESELRATVSALT